MLDYNRISPSILASDLTDIRNTIKRIENDKIDWIHFDVMDGVFVPNLTFGMDYVKHCRKLTQLFFDVHLMIEQPEKYIEKFINSGSDLLTFHIEATKEVDKCFDIIRNHPKNVLAGVSIKPKTDLESIIPYLDKIDLILIMTVEPGFAGQNS